MFPHFLGMHSCTATDRYASSIRTGCISVTRMDEGEDGHPGTILVYVGSVLPRETVLTAAANQ